MKSLLFPKLHLSSLATSVEAELRRAFTVSLAFSILPENAGEPVEALEGWMALGRSLPEGCVADLGLPKPNAEWLMAGDALPPVGMQRVGLPVDVQVGDSARSFVVGNPADVSSAIAFPLPAENAPSPLPVPIADKNMAKLGTFDDLWLQKYWPGPPTDFDWTWYNQSQQAQWLRTPFTGTEHVRVTNMNGSHAILSARLPGLRLRLFADYGSEEANDWHEVAMKADTLWLLPNAGIAMLLWHGTAPTRDERSSDIREVAACLEPVDQPPHNARELIAEAREANAAVTEPVLPPQPQEEPEAEPVAMPTPPPVATPPEIAAPPAAAAAAAVASAPAAALATPKPPQSTAEMVEEMFSTPDSDLQEAVQMANDALAQQGLPPISVQDVKAELAKQKQNALDVLGKADDFDMEKELAEAGISKEMRDNLLKATELPVPERAAFVSQADYELALGKYGKKFTELTGATPDVVERMLTTLRGMEPGGEADMLKAFGVPEIPSGPAGLAAELAKNGYAADPKLLESALASLSAPSLGDADTAKAMGALATAMGGDAEEAMSVFKNSMGTARLAMYKMEDVQQLLARVATEHPEQKAALQRLVSSLDEQPTDEIFDLKSLAMRAGVVDKCALDKIAAGDPMPDLEAPQETPAMPEEAAAAPAPPATDDMAGDMPATVDGPAAVTEEEEAAENTDAEMADINAAPDTVFLLDGKNLAGASLAGLCLANAQLAGADLSGTDFCGSDLSGANLSGAKLDGAKLAGANLRGADLTGADLANADFSGADATDATFDQCYFSNTLLQGIVAEKASFAQIDARGQDFADARLAKASFSEAELERARFGNADMVGVTFEQSRLNGADFLKANMPEARIYQNELPGTRFAGANLQGSNWLGNNGKASLFAGADLQSACFEECDLTESSLAGVAARECRLLSCDLHAADLSHADLMQGSLRGTKLGNARLEGASLYGVDMYLAGVNSNTVLAGAHLAATCLVRGEKP